MSDDVNAPRPAVIRELKEQVAALKKQMAGETRARETAEKNAATEKARADRAEQALRDMTRDRERERVRADAAEDELRSLGG